MLKLKPNVSSSYGLFVKHFFSKNKRMSFRFADAAAEWTAMRTNSKRIYTELVDRHNKEQLVKSLPNIVKRYKFTQNYYVRRSSRYLLTKYFHMPKMPMSPFLLYCKVIFNSKSCKLILKREVKEKVVSWENFSDYLSSKSKKNPKYF